MLSRTQRRRNVNSRDPGEELVNIRWGEGRYLLGLPTFSFVVSKFSWTPNCAGRLLNRFLPASPLKGFSLQEGDCISCLYLHFEHGVSGELRAGLHHLLLQGPGTKALT